jgi:hypothetical protein
MSTNSLLANLLLAASMGLGATAQAAKADAYTPAEEPTRAAAPAFSIDENGVLHGADAADKGGPTDDINWRCNKCK